MVFSKKFNVPLLYKPFIHSDMLRMHQQEKHYDEKAISKFKNIVSPKIIDEHFQLTENTLYVMPFYGLESVFTRDNYELIKEDMKNLIKPEIPLNLLVPPSNTISVAVHLRKGGGFDPMSIINAAPLKFPPDSFYIGQIIKICSLFPNQTLYVYLFTDDKDPKALVNKYANQLPSKKIIWDYRKNNDNFNATTLEDFFSMMSFDCLIRPESSLSIWAQRLGNHTIIIAPKHSTPKNGEWIIDDVYMHSTSLKS